MFVLFSSFLQMYAYLGEGECVTAVSHVLAMSHVAVIGTAIGAAIGAAIGNANGCHVTLYRCININTS